MKIPITLACGLYERTFGLRGGTVPVEGVGLNFLPMMPVETFRRRARHGAFDAAEFSLSTFMALHRRGDRRFVGVPVYPSRRFRHEHVWINVHSGIRSPADLKGKRVGIQKFVQAAALWIRGFLQQDYRVRTQDIDWYFGGHNTPDPHFKQRIELELPSVVRASIIAGDQCLAAVFKFSRSRRGLLPSCRHIPDHARGRCKAGDLQKIAGSCRLFTRPSCRQRISPSAG